jgi:hypothetical protein
LCSGFSEEADRARRLWANLILEVEAAGPVAVPKEKIFKPKFPRIPVLDDYTKAAPEEFWAEFPEYYVCPAKPSLNGKKLKRWADALGCSEPDRLNRVLECIRSGADIGCRGEARKPSRSKNAASAFQYGPQVTDAIAEWVQKGYAYGPVAAEEVPAAAKVSGIMVRPKPNGSVRVILNLSAPKGRSVNDGIDKTDFPATMSSTAAWLAVLDTAGRGCLMTKTDWAAAYKHVWVREQDTDLQWFSWGGRFFKELCLIFGGVSSAGLFDDPAKILLDLVCRRAGFPRAMVCQHLDDVCAAAAAGSDTLYRFDAAFKELAADIGVELAPRDDHDKSFAPCTAGVVFGVHYDTVAWTWAIPDEKLARTCMLLEEAIAAESMAAKQIRSLVGKLIHVKPLVPAGRFNMDKIMRVYRAAARTEEHVAITSACTRQFRFWYLFLRVCSGRVDIPRPQGRLTAGALDAFTDAAGGSGEAVGRGTGGVMGDWWYYIPWAKRINAGGWKVDGKKVGRKLSALELVGPLVVVAAGHQVCRGQTLQVWVDNAGSVEVYRKGYSRNCRLCTTLVKAMATVAAGIGCRLEVIKITRCTGTGATLADQLSKARFGDFRRTAEQAGWPLQLGPARIPAVLLKWLDRPFPCDRLGAAILEELSTSSKLAGYTPGYTWR